MESFFDIKKMLEKEGLSEEEIKKAIEENPKTGKNIFLEPRRVGQIISVIEKNKEKYGNSRGNALTLAIYLETNLIKKIKHSIRKIADAKRLYGAILYEKNREEILSIWKEMVLNSLQGATSIYSAKDLTEDAPIGTEEHKRALQNWEKYADKEIELAETLHELRKLLKLCPHTHRNKCIRKIAEFYKKED